MARINRKHTFTVVQDVYKEIRTSGGGSGLKLIKPKARWEVDFYLNDIIGVSHVLNNLGNIRKGVCQIYHRDKGELIVLGNKTDISKLVFDEEYENSKIGFNNKQ